MAASVYNACMCKRDKVTITEDIRRELLRLREQTGVSPSALLDGHGDSVPGGLTAEMVKRWASGRTKTADCELMDWVLARWREIDNKNERRVPIRHEDRQAMKHEKERTGVSVHALLKQREDLPDGLTAAVVAGWLAGDTKTARQDHLDYILALWRSLPDAPREGDVQVAPAATTGWTDAVRIDDSYRQRLRALQEETGYKSHALFQWARSSGKAIPPDLNASKVYRWLSGQIQRARQEHLDWVLAMYERLLQSADTRITLTPKHRAALAQERERTAVSQAALLKDADDAPSGLRAAHISDWINGYAQTTRADYYHYVLDRWRALPDG